MKKVLTVALTSLMLFFVCATKAQGQEILKSFINKNDFILRSVQKNGIHSQAQSLETSVKSILKLQLISIALYDSDRELSKRAAYQARVEGISFLQANSSVPPQAFKLTEKEKIFFGTPTGIASLDQNLSQTELRSVEELNAKDPSSLNSFVTSLK